MLDSGCIHLACAHMSKCDNSIVGDKFKCLASRDSCIGRKHRKQKLCMGLAFMELVSMLHHNAKIRSAWHSKRVYDVL